MWRCWNIRLSVVWSWLSNDVQVGERDKLQAPTCSSTGLGGHLYHPMDTSVHIRALMPSHSRELNLQPSTMLLCVLWGQHGTGIISFSKECQRRLEGGNLEDFAKQRRPAAQGGLRSEQERNRGKSGLFSAAGAWSTSGPGLIEEAKSLGRWKSQPHAQGQEMCDFIYPSFHPLVSKNSHSAVAKWRKVNLPQFGMNFLAFLKC